jgi:hypothetical protein
MEQKTYQYAFDSVNKSIAERASVLLMRGNYGWELVTVIDDTERDKHIFYWKREKLAD